MPEETDRGSLLRAGAEGCWGSADPIAAPAHAERARDDLRILRELGTRMLMIDEINSVLVGSPRQQRRFLQLLRFLSNELAGRHRLRRRARSTVPALLSDPLNYVAGSRKSCAGAVDLRPRVPRAFVNILVQGLPLPSAAAAGGQRQVASARWSSAPVASPSSVCRGLEARWCRGHSQWAGRAHRTVRAGGASRSGEVLVCSPKVPLDYGRRHSHEPETEARPSVPRLPLAPSPISDEAFSSWIARVAARATTCVAFSYDLARVALPKWSRLRWRCIA